MSQLQQSEKRVLVGHSQSARDDKIPIQFHSANALTKANCNGVVIDNAIKSLIFGSRDISRVILFYILINIV